MKDSSGTYDVLVRDISQWANSHTVVRSSRIENSCFFVDYTTKKLQVDIESKLILSKVVLWLFAIDDYLDTNASLSDVRKFKDLFAAGLKKQQIDAFADYQSIISEITDSLCGKVKRKFLLDYWKQTLSKTLDAMIFENTNRILHAKVDEGEYIEQGKYSIGTPLFLSCFILSNERVAHKSAKELEKFLRSADRLFLVTRLANDVRSFEKEQEEGKVNAVSFLLERKNLKVKEAKELIFATAQKDIELLSNDLRKHDNSDLKDFCLNVASLAFAFYKKWDFSDKIDTSIFKNEKNHVSRNS